MSTPLLRLTLHAALRVSSQSSRETLLRALHALTLFRSSGPRSSQKAIETFITLDINPAKVISLFPETVSGRLAAPEEDWVELLGGPSKEKVAAAKAASASIETTADPKDDEEAGTGRKLVTGTLAAFGLGHRPESVVGGAADESDTASMRGRTVTAEKGPSVKDKLAAQKESFEALLHYLSDRRQKVLGALSHVPPAALGPLETTLPVLSTVPKDELLSIPSIPLTRLTPEQVYRVAQLVDTALFKAYLAVRPSLVGSLCRLDNFCEVVEVEEQLKERKVSPSAWVVTCRHRHGG
jgi:hypothetical protein